MRICKLIAPFLGLALITGCSNNHASQTQKTTQEWNSARASVLTGLARQQFNGANFDDSRKSIDEALKLDNKNPAIHILSARVAIEQGQLEVALNSLKSAREINPKLPETDYLTGVIYQRWQKPSLALQYYESASQNAPAELAYLLARAEMLVNLDRADEGLSLLQSKVAYFENSATIRDAVGQLLVSRGKYAEAVDSLRQASILDTHDLAVREHYGLALFHAGRHREAGDVLAKLITVEPYAHRADLITAVAECDMHLNRFREARTGFETASSLDPASSAIWLGLAKAALQLNDMRRVELSVKKAISVDAANSEAYLLLGYLRLRQNQLPDAIVAFRKSSALDHADTVSLCMIGYSYEKLGKAEKAMEYYAEALKLKPNDELATQLMAGVDTGE
jgi:tetratricopeptide (TPR) repeat protein